MKAELLGILAALNWQPAETPAPLPTETAPAPVPAPDLVIPAGTEIPLVLGETLSSKTHVKGDLFHLLAAADVVIDNVVVIPQGTRIIAELTRAEKKGAFGRSGKLEARLLYAELGDTTIRLRGSLGARGKGGTTETVLAAVAIGTLAFVVTGKSAEIIEGTELSGYLNADTKIRRPGHSSHSPATP